MKQGQRLGPITRFTFAGSVVGLLVAGSFHAQAKILREPEPFSSPATVISDKRADGYRGIWYTVGQWSKYGFKYSGGLGTYTANHVPMAIHAPQVNKTFFVYGGAAFTETGKHYLLDMVSYYDHERHVVPRPTIVHDKGERVNDPHDNPSLSGCDFKSLSVK